MTKKSEQDTPALIQTGVEGLDDVLRGGVAPNRLYLIEGNPGFGKTTLAMQFLRAGEGYEHPSHRHRRDREIVSGNYKGIIIGEPLREFQGVPTGSPEFTGNSFFEVK